MTLPRFISPPAEVSKFDTGLTFTDILFGLVISQIFLRLQEWGQLPWIARWELLAATALVLGSWIGFRRSRNRSRYELKFFNLPLGRFLLDQSMIILYFRIATLIPDAPHPVLPPQALVHQTTLTLLIVFGLYVLWDLLGILMAYAGKSGAPRYPAIDEETKKIKPGDRSRPDFVGATISVIAAVLFTLLFLVFYHGISFLFVDIHRVIVGTGMAEIVFAITLGLLLGYRWAKEIRSSYR